MSNKKYVLNSMLACVLGLYLLVVIFVKTFAPQIILPHLGIPELTLISLAALLLDHYLAPGAERCYICIPAASAITFFLLSFGAYMGVREAARLAVLGSIVFTAVTWLFSSIQDRLSSGPAAKAAPVMSALGLYLASQVFAGMFL